MVHFYFINFTVFMKKLSYKAFTLVELLVVITILAIISVVAYQNFWWAVDKAVYWRKISDVSTIETSLQQYKADKNYYPPTDLLDWATNKWWYDDNATAVTATPSNKIDVAYTWEEIQSITSASGWWRVYGSWAFTTVQIWAKWTISRATVWKKYLSKDLYDPELWDLKVQSTSSKMIDEWIGRYIYATFKKGTSWDWATNKRWVDYNLAFTVKKENSDKFITKIVGSYDSESCYEDSANCPDTLIGSWNDILDDNDEISSDDSTLDNQWIPYPITDFR